MEYRIGDRVQIISDSVNEYPEYVGNFAIISAIDKEYEFPYELTILDVDENQIDFNLMWEESGLQLASPELIEQRAEENLQAFKEIDSKIIKAAEYAGITREQAYKFMDRLN